MYSYTKDSNPPIYLNVYWTLPQNIQCRINYCPILDNSNTCSNNTYGDIITARQIIDNKSPIEEIKIIREKGDKPIPTNDINTFYYIQKVKGSLTGIERNTSGFILPEYTEYIIPAFTDSTPNEWIQL